MRLGQAVKKNATCRARPAPSVFPVPQEGARPVVYADRVGTCYVAQKSDEHRKNHGLYLTPVPAADFMAGRIKVSGPKLRILDPAAGAGILCCAAVEALVSRDSKPDIIELVVHEVDGGLIAPLHVVLDYLIDWCRDHGVQVAVQVEETDFIMAHAETLRSLGGLFPYRSVAEDFDIVIANPPYFKISKADPRASAASTVVHGQPNIYALFMAVSAVLLRENGDFVFITPRSFTSGPYFRQFRNVFFDMIRPTEVHVFGSRRDAFSRDEVLQENVIVSGTRQNLRHRSKINAPFVISSSRGVRDIGESNRREIPLNTALDLDSTNKILRLPICEEDDDVLAKEEARRLTAAPYIATDFAIPEVGFENHLNYIHRPRGTLAEDEAWGLAALYNSRLLDTWFRAVNGNTQVSATELRAMRLPAHQTIIALGQYVKHLADPMESLDRLVMDLIAHPELEEAVVGQH